MATKWDLLNADKLKAAKRAWIIKNKRKVRAAQRKYYLANKALVKARAVVWKKENIEKVRDGGRKYIAKARATLPKLTPEKRKEYQTRYKVKYPDAHLARRKFSSACRNGTLKRPPKCSKCKTSCVPHGHHNNYDKPLEVVWLCAKCHGKVHRKV